MKLAAIAHSKHRNMIGLVGIEINTQERKAYVKLVRQWSRDKINEIPYEIGELYRKIQWSDTYIDQQTGQHFIQDLKKEHLRLKVITTQKNLKDPHDIERAKVMDKIEMVQLMLVLRKNHQVVFPESPTNAMKELELQMAIFSEHKTEAGNIDYFAPGEEFDNLTKALLIDCFAARKYLMSDHETAHVGGRAYQKPVNVLDDYYKMSKLGTSIIFD